MKLLFAIKRLSGATGGAERVLCAICSELAGRGHDVTIVTSDRPGGSSFYPLDSRVRRIDLAIGNSADRASVGETLRRMAALRELAKKERPQVAVGFMHSAYVPLAFSLALLGIPVVGSEHIVPQYYRRRSVQYALIVASAAFMKKVTVLSESIRGGYSSPIREKMVAMPNPVMRASGRAELDANKARYVLLNVARLVPQKDHVTLLHAFSRIATAYPTWDLKIIGEGPLRPELERLVSVLGLEGRVIFPGVKSDIGGEYRAADVLVTSSLFESFGLVAAEAMSHGLPVVGFADCPGTNELIENGRTGLLAAAQPDRAASLAMALERLMSDPGLRRRLGDAGRSAIGRGHSVERVSDLWERLLADTCANC